MYGIPGSLVSWVTWDEATTKTIKEIVETPRKTLDAPFLGENISNKPTQDDPEVQIPGDLVQELMSREPKLDPITMQGYLKALRLPQDPFS